MWILLPSVVTIRPCAVSFTSMTDVCSSTVEPTAAERESARRVTDARKLFTEWREQMLNQLDAAIRAANTADMENPSEAEALAIRYKETFESWADILLHRPLDEQMQIFRERKGVERLCRMTLQNTPTKSKTA